MDTFNRLLIKLLPVVLVMACDRSLEPSQEEISPLVGEWVFQYIVMDGDTLRYVDDVMYPYPLTSPIAGERWSGITQRSILFDSNGLYKLRQDNSIGWGLAYGYDRFEGIDYGSFENFQPLTGRYFISDDRSLIVQNGGFDYEKSYEVLKLTQDTLRRKMIGGYYDLDKLLKVDYIEVFKKKQ